VELRHPGHPPALSRVPLPTFLRALGAIAAGALVIRLLQMLTLGVDAPEAGDSVFYHVVAGQLAQGLGFVDPLELVAGRLVPTAAHPPLWPVVLSIATQAGLETETAHRVVTCVVGTGAVAAIGFLGRRVGGGVVGLVAAGLAAVHPVLVTADGSLMSESLYGLLVALALLAALRLAERPTPLRGLLLGVALGLAALTRTEALVLALGIGAVLAWRWRRAGRPARASLAPLAVVAAAIAVVVAPWTVRNAERIGAPVLVSTNDATVLAGANCDATYRGDDLGLWRLDCVSRRAPGVLEGDQAGRWRDEAFDHARENAGRLPVVAVVRVLRTWDLYQPRRQALFFSEGRDQTLAQAGVAVFYLLLLLAVRGLVLLRRRGAVPHLLLVVPAVVTFTSLVGFGLPRFRHAADIVLVVLAAVALVHDAPPVLERLRRRPTVAA
jgi:4-amino-4-deoxy-L-arabinose transferase-like glycosyltransferase